MRPTNKHTFQTLFLLLFLNATTAAQDSVWRTYIDAGTVAFNEKRFAEAERRFKLARKEAEHFGQQDPRLAQSCYKLALVYLHQQTPAQAQQLEARQLAQQALTIWEKNLGPEPLEVAAALEELAGAFLKVQEYAFVEMLLSQSLAIRKSVLIPAHPAIATTLHYMAITSYLLKNFDASSERYAQALAILEKAHTPNRDEEIITILRNSAVTAQARGDHIGAESLLKRALKLREEGYGSEHVGALKILDELANLYATQNKLAEAAAARKRQLEFAERIYGVNDSRVSAAVTELASTHVARGDYTSAESLYREKLAKLAEGQGDTRDTRLKLLDGLVNVYWSQGAYAAIEPVLRECLEIAKASAGSDGVLYAYYLNVQGSLLLDQERYADAEPVFKRALEIRERTPGQPDAELARSLNNLAKDYYYLGKYDLAEPLYQKALSISQQLKNGSPAGTAWYSKNYALLLYAQGKNDQAESRFREALGVFDKSADERSAAVSLYELAELFRGQKKYSEAELRYKEALVQMEKVSQSSSQTPRDQLMLAKLLERYAALMRTTSREAEAVRMEARGAELRSKHERKP